MIKPMLTIKHKTICTKSRTMTLSMKPDLQKPTSPSSFSGLFGGATRLQNQKLQNLKLEFALKIESNIGAKFRIPDPETYHQAWKWSKLLLCYLGHFDLYSIKWLSETTFFRVRNLFLIIIPSGNNRKLVPIHYYLVKANKRRLSLMKLLIWRFISSKKVESNFAM